MTGVTIKPGALSSLSISDIKALHDFAQERSEHYRKILNQDSIDMAVLWESMRNIFHEKLLEAIQYITNNDKLI